MLELLLAFGPGRLLLLLVAKLGGFHFRCEVEPAAGTLLGLRLGGSLDLGRGRQLHGGRGRPEFAPIRRALLVVHLFLLRLPNALEALIAGPRAVAIPVVFDPAPSKEITPSEFAIECPLAEEQFVALVLRLQVVEESLELTNLALEGAGRSEERVVGDGEGFQLLLQHDLVG